MSDDGADLGVKADSALATVLGGEPEPSEEERQTPEQMREWLMSLSALRETWADHIARAKEARDAGKKLREGKVAVFPTRLFPRRSKEGEVMSEKLGRTQLAFEGLDVSGQQFSMRTPTDLQATEAFHIGDSVGGEWVGSVVGIHYDKDRYGLLIRKHVVAVEKATIG